MKKIIVGFSALLVAGSVGIGHAEAVVDLPNTTSFPSRGHHELIPGENLAWTKVDSDEIALVDLEDGEKLQTIKTASYYSIQDYAISDDQKRIAIIDGSKIKVYNEFAEVV